MAKTDVLKDIANIFLNKAISEARDSMERELSLDMLFENSPVKSNFTPVSNPQSSNHALFSRLIKDHLQNTPPASAVCTGLIPQVEYPGANIKKCVKIDPASHSHTQGHVHKTTLLTEHLNNLLKHEASYPESKEAKQIIHSMVGFCEKICHKLDERYPLFRNCYFLETGSIFEGLKVDSPNEFDFMIVMPQLANSDVVKFKPSEDYQLLNFDIIDKVMFNLEQDEEDSSSFFSQIDDILKVIILQILPVKWKISPDINGCILFNSRIAHTLRLIYDGDEYKKLPIDVDFCFSVPLKHLPIWHDHHPLARLRSAAKLIQIPYPFFYIIRAESCRLSFSVYEKSIVNQYANDSFPKCLLRLAKVVRSKYLPKKYDKTTRLMTSLLSTYWLKTVMYEMLSENRCDVCWKEASMADALIDTFQKILDSLDKEELFSFFIPKYNLLSAYSSQQYSVAFNYKLTKSLLADEKAHLMNEISSLLKILSDFNDGIDMTKTLNNMEETQQKISEEELDQKLHEDLLNMLYYYAYNNADDELGYNTMRTFIARYFPNMVMTGCGYDIVLTENNEIFNIDQKLMEMYGNNDDGKEFNYFPSSR